MSARSPALAKLHLELGDLEGAGRFARDGASSQAERPGGRERARRARACRAGRTLGDPPSFRQRVAADPADHQARFDLAMASTRKGEREEPSTSFLKSSGATAIGTRKARASSWCSSSRLGARWTTTLAGRRRLSSMLFS